jgi:hypothetical protein
MSRIGLLVEGTIDEAILEPLILEALRPRAAGRPHSVAFFPFPPNGFGEIPKNLRTLVRYYEQRDERARLGCDLFVIIHDGRKTEFIQKEIREILREARDFPSVYGLAIQEVEAWILGDIENLNKRVFHLHPIPKLPHRPERDPDPKKTLVDLFIRPSKSIGYDRWNQECARLLAPHMRPTQVARRCPRGFGDLLAKLSRKTLTP